MDYQYPGAALLTFVVVVVVGRTVDVNVNVDVNVSVVVSSSSHAGWGWKKLKYENLGSSRTWSVMGRRGRRSCSYSCSLFDDRHGRHCHYSHHCR